MRCVQFAIVVVFIAAIGVTTLADEAKDEALKKEHKQIEGAWKIVEFREGTKGNLAEFFGNARLIIGPDGIWNLRQEDGKGLKGTSTVDPTTKPKGVDFTMMSATEKARGKEKDDLYLGIYEISETKERLCFAIPGEKRPADFTPAPPGAPGRSHMHLTLEREKAK